MRYRSPALLVSALVLCNLPAHGEPQTAAPLQILAQPQKDRAPLGDPSLEASTAAALQPVTLAPPQPAPFVAVNLPDPFEHVATGRLRPPPEENFVPPVIPVRTPR